MIDCYCDYDPPSVFSEKLVKARKAHRCAECSRTISPGESYLYAFGVWDGFADSYHTCSHCADIKQFVRNNIPCFCWGYGNLIEDAKNTIEEAYFQAPAEVAGVAFGLGRLLVKARRDRQARRAAA